MDKYEELMTRFALVKEQWAELVAGWRSEGLSVNERWSMGVRLLGDGSLEMVGLDGSGKRIVALRSESGSEQVVVSWL